MPDDLEQRGHLLESYGECSAGRHCSCLRAVGTAGWMGTECPLWKSWGCRTWDEVREKQLAAMRNRE